MIAPDAGVQSPSVFRFAEFANSVMDSKTAKAGPLAAEVPAPPPLAAATAPQAPVNPIEPPAPPAQAELESPRLTLTEGDEDVPPVNDIAAKGRIEGVNVTFYDCKTQGFCGAMYNGRKVYQGAAACSWNLAIGTKFTIVGDPTRRVYVCEDRGLLANTWVDIFWNDPRDGRIWQSKVGRYGTIEIVSLP